MDLDTAELNAFLDREKIRDVIVRLARGEDRRDAEILKGCYWPDSGFDYAMYAGEFPDYLAWVVPGADVITNTQHILAQTLIELEDGAVATRAKAETHVVSYHRVIVDEVERDTVIGGRYLDKLEKRDGTWGIAHRTMLYDWYQDWGPAVDWSQGVMGYPFLGPHYTGRANGDWSEVFFGKRPA
ncbi:MAG: nuclear transport factor 2 family protein [Novosphingobium sp.]